MQEQHVNQNPQLERAAPPDTFFSRRQNCDQRSEKINLSQLENNLTRITCLGNSFVDLMKTFNYLAISIDKYCNETFAPAQVVKNVKDVMGTTFLMRMSITFYYQYTEVSIVLQTQTDVLALVPRLNDGDAG